MKTRANQSRMRDLRSGMTLLEVLIVMAMILILAGAVVTIGRTIRQRAEADLTRSLLEVLTTALQVYYDENGSFPQVPPFSQDLYIALNASPDSRKIAEAVSPQLIVNRVYVDSWGKSVRYEYAAGTAFPILTSAGPDKVFGTKDDIKNNK